MKILKLFFLSTCFIFSTAAFAQNETEIDDLFVEYVQTQFRKIKQASNDKDIMQLATLIKGMDSSYMVLSEEKRQEHSGIMNYIYYNIACYSSLAKDKKNAIAYFEKAINLGYSDYSHAIQDSDFENIRQEKAFKKQMEILKKKEKNYIAILKEAGKYGTPDTTNLPSFNYEPISNGRIKAVRKFLNLDSIAGQGDEISKIINLLNWVHNTIEHDGSHYPICEHDAIDLYNYAKATNRGLNCRMLVIVLNECYLSMGFKSRFVTCLPKDKKDPDCHVITCVYSQMLNKWVWMNPTFNAYLKDENGILLSIEEVRERLITDKPIILNEDANWNNKKSKTKKEYIDSYMAKNLYRLECVINNYFNVESPYRNSSSRHISLAPLEYGQDSTFKNVTHDPVYFWQKPTADIKQ